MYDDIEMTYAQEGLLDFVSNIFKRSASTPADTWTKQLFGNLLGSEIKPVVYNPGPFHPNVEVDTNTGTIRIYNINYNRLIRRIRTMYGEKRLDLIFNRTYSSHDVNRFMKKKINRSEMRITSLQTPIFFALELAIIFRELYAQYKERTYINISKTIYEKSWLKDADTRYAAAPELSVNEVNRKLNDDYQLLPHQERFIKNYLKLKAVLNLNGMILSFDQGMGKTLTSIALADVLGYDKVFIVCPNGNTSNWKTEIESYFKNQRHAYVCNSKEIYNAKKVQYVIVNNESIPSIYQYIKPGQKSMFILDESQNFRNRAGKRVADLLTLRDKLNTSDVLVMSGTPIKALPNEIVPAMSLIDPIFTTEAAIIYDRCFKFDSFMAMDIVQHRFGKIIYRDIKENALQLPQKHLDKLRLTISNPEPFLLSTVADEVKVAFQKHYDELIKDDLVRRDRFVYLVKKYSTAPLEETNRYLETVAVITRRDNNDKTIHELDQNRLDKYIPTYITPYVNDKNIVKEITDLQAKFLRIERSAMGKAIGEVYPPKRNAMFISLFDENFDTIASYIRNGEKKTIIFSQFVPVIDHITAELNRKGINAVKVTGEITGDARESALKKFHEDENMDVLVASSKTLGTGVTLIEANQMMFFGPPWRSTDFDQCCDRIYRIGQTSDVYIWDVILDTKLKNLSNRMDAIMDWSNDMFHAAIDPTIVTEYLGWELDELYEIAEESTDLVPIPPMPNLPPVIFSSPGKISKAGFVTVFNYGLTPIVDTALPLLVKVMQNHAIARTAKLVDIVPMTDAPHSDPMVREIVKYCKSPMPKMRRIEWFYDGLEKYLQAHPDIFLAIDASCMGTEFYSEIERTPVIIVTPTANDEDLKKVTSSSKANDTPDVLKRFKMSEYKFTKYLMSKSLRACQRVPYTPKLTLYHLSENSNITKLKPAVPRTPMNMENFVIKRISASPTVQQCVESLPYADGTFTYTIYKLALNPTSKIYKPPVTYVPDIIFTNEHWVITPTLVEYVDTITLRFKDGKYTVVG